MKNLILFCISIVFVFLSASYAQAQSKKIEKSFKIAFGSCSNQEKPQPLWKTVLKRKPNLWIWLGDNVYGDTEDMDVLRRKYAKQKSHPDYQKIRKTTQIIGVWDDHDFGVNDGGKTYPKKEESQQIMLDFLDVSADSPLRKQKGVYSSQTFEADGLNIKVILLDARYFRDSLKREENAYSPNLTGEVLGEEQWKWLEQELTNSKADLYIIGSGIQFIPEEHPYEKWANFPEERKRFFELLAKTKTENVLLISGDRHMSEISRYKNTPLNQPIFEITSSGLTNVWSKYREEPNPYRVGEMVLKINFGLFDIRFDAQKIYVRANIVGKKNKILLEQNIEFSRSED